MTATSADQCVAYDGLIQPEKIPGAASSDNRGGQLNAAAIVDACQQARSVARQVRSGVSTVSTEWTVMPSVFEMPGADPVYNAMTTPGTSLTTFAGNLDRMATALEDFAGEIEPLRIAFDEVRGRAQEFVNSLEPGNKVWMRASSTTSYQWDSNASPHSTYAGPSSYAYGASASAESGWHSASDAASYLRGRGETARVSGGTVEILVTWLESGEHVRRNNDLMDEVADLYARLHAAEVECANRINAMREDMCIAPIEAVEAWQLKQDGVELPWGARVEEQRNCGEQVGHGFYQFGKGTVEGLGSLISYNPMSGEWGDWDHAGATWTGIGDIVVSIGTVSLGPIGLINMAINGPEAYTESLETVKELGKSLVAWDTWEDAPAQAATETILNIGTAFIPVGGWALAGTKGLSAAAGATRITAALGKLDNLGPAVLARLLPDGPRIQTPRIDIDGVRIDVDMPSNPGGLLDDAARVGTDAGNAPGGGRADAPAGPGGGVADDAARAGNDAPNTPDAGKPDAPAGPGAGAADDAARAGNDTPAGPGGGKPDAPAGPGAGAADDAARAGNGAPNTPDAGKPDAPAGPGTGVADDAARAGNDTPTTPDTGKPDAPAGPGAGAADDAAGGGGRSDGGTGTPSPQSPDMPSDSVIRDFVDSRGLSSEQLHDLRRTPVDALDAAEVTMLKELRELIPAPTDATPMIKVMPLDNVQKYLSGEWTTVQGFVARASDIDPQAGLARVVDDLRLDYDPGTGNVNPFTDPSAQGYAYIEFNTPDAARIATPYSTKFDGDVNMPEPYTGNGFVGNVDGTWRPEYLAPGGPGALRLGDGAKLWQVGPDGPQLVGIWDKKTKGFLTPGGTS